MWIVKLALNRPYTFLVAALLVLILSPIVILRTPIDIFHNIDIPVVSILWNYTGFSPQQMEQRIVSPTERSLTTTVNDIEHTESQSLNGIGMIKVFFQTATPSQELFRIAQTKTLRIYINIPENFSAEIVPGITATVEMASSPNQKITGKSVRTSQSIDPSSLTLLAEVDVPNPNGKLLPGGFAQGHFDITTSHPPLVIPGNTLIFRAQGTQVGIVDPDTLTVHLKDIKIGRDFGTKLKVVDG